MSQPTKARVLRGPNDGNLLWKLYSELGATRRQEFKAALDESAIPYFQFILDGKVSRKLSQLPVYRAAMYSNFFGDAFMWEDEAAQAALHSGRAAQATNEGATTNEAA